MWCQSTMFYFLFAVRTTDSPEANNVKPQPRTKPFPCEIALALLPVYKWTSFCLKCSFKNLSLEPVFSLTSFPGITFFWLNYFTVIPNIFVCKTRVLLTCRKIWLCQCMLVVFKLFNMFLSSVQSHASCKLWNGIVLYFIHDTEWWRCVKASYYITIYTHIFYCACQFTQCTFFCFHFVILLVQKSLLVFLFELCAQYMFCFQNFVFLFCHDQHIFCVKCQSSSGFTQIMIYLLMSVLLWMSFWIFKVISGYCLYG